MKNLTAMHQAAAAAEQPADHRTRKCLRFFTWEDVMYRIYVRQAIEAGLKDSDEGRTVDV